MTGRMTIGDGLVDVEKAKRAYQHIIAWRDCPKVGDLLRSTINSSRWNLGEHVLVLKVSIIDDESCSFPLDVYHLELKMRLPIIWNPTAPSNWTCFRAE